jgi:MinD-like ATPase involved in chromosome partitioning or flagellar assembly
MKAGAASMIISNLLGSVSSITYELTTSDALLRSPLALCRRIGFVQLRGGSGASTTAGYVASMLARRRTGMVLGVNASAGEANMLWQAGLTRSSGGASRLGGSSDQNRRLHPSSAADARAGLPVTRGGLIALDLALDHLAPSAGSWFEQVSPLARFYDLVITDWGVRDEQVDLRQVARASHVVCLVARADRFPAEEAAALTPALAEVEDQPRVVLALVDVGRTAQRTPQLLRNQLPVPVISIPYDPRRAQIRPVASRQLPTSSRLAYTRLCTALMAEAVIPTFRRLVTPASDGQSAPLAGGKRS